MRLDAELCAVASRRPPRFGADAVACADDAEHARRRAPTSSDVWPAASSRSSAGAAPRPASRCPALPAAGGADERCCPSPSAAVTPAPGWAWNSLDGIERQLRVAGFMHDRAGPAGARCAARRWRRAAAFRRRRRSAKRHDVAQFELPLGQGAGLVEGEGVDLGQPFQGGAALDQHAGACQPAQGGDDGRGRGQDQGTRDRPPPAPPVSDRGCSRTPPERDSAAARGRAKPAGCRQQARRGK